MARLRCVLSAVGAVLTGTGVLILLFVAYQLWGTGLFTSGQQADLKSEFEARATAAEVAASSTTSTTTTPRPQPPPPSGEAVAILRIPKIGVEVAVVHGVGVADLRKGPGHYPQTPLPGENGNAAIAGHRTTYGAPFNRLDELSAGDEILVTTLIASYEYRVAATRIVRPDQVEVLDPTPTPILTLTTCNPKYSARERLVVVADLSPGQAASPAPPAATAAPPLPLPGEAFDDAGLASSHSRWPTVTWGVVTALVGAGWWLAIRRYRRWPSYLGGAIPFLVSLFFFYAHLELLLPANF